MVNGNSTSNDTTKILSSAHFCYNKLIHWLLELNPRLIDTHIIRTDYRADWANCKRLKHRATVEGAIWVPRPTGAEVGVGLVGVGVNIGDTERHSDFPSTLQFPDNLLLA